VDAQAAHKASELVDQKTGGQLKLEVFDNGSLFDQTSEYPALERGDLAMAYETAHFIADRVPEATLLTIPFLIQNVDHLYAVIDSKVGQDVFAAALEQAGVRPLTAIANGERNLMLRDSVGRVETPADMNGVRLRMANAPAWVQMGESLGANPTPLAFGEIYLALQTGVIDGQDNALSTAINANFHEVSDQVVLTRHYYNSIWPAVNERIYQSLCPEFQQALQEAWIEARDFGTQINAEQEAAAVDTLIEAGLDVYEPDVQAFRDHARDFYFDNPAVTDTFVEGHVELIEDLAPDQ
jgi:tripartite ATP-independent transporter DctP family solute receptor